MTAMRLVQISMLLQLATRAILSFQPLSSSICPTSRYHTKIFDRRSSKRVAIVRGLVTNASNNNNSNNDHDPSLANGGVLSNGDTTTTTTTTSTTSHKSSSSTTRRPRSVGFPSFAYNTNKIRLNSTRRERDDNVVYSFLIPPNTINSTTGQEQQHSDINSMVMSEIGGSMTWVTRVLSVVLESLPIDGAAATRTRLLFGRSYARKEAFSTVNLDTPPSLSDLLPPQSDFLDKLWISSPFRLICFGITYLIFPYLLQAASFVADMQLGELNEIAAAFGPGISILYGTFISLTLSILYTRQRTIQQNVANECALLVVIIRNLLFLFQKDSVKAIEAGQYTADQVRTLVGSSRGEELMLLIYSDPYARMLELIDNYALTAPEKDVSRQSSLIGSARTTLLELTKFRAQRLSDEATTLPPIHFFILTLLTVLILLSYVLSIVPTVDGTTGMPSTESALLFGVLTNTYILFYNFASDLNDPFRGVYQVRRSCAASQLLEIKWLMTNHPVLRGQIDFEHAKEESSGTLIRSPGLQDVWFENEPFDVDTE